MEQQKEEGSIISGFAIKMIIFLTVLAFLCAVVLVVKYKFEITSVKVVGNEHYTEDEIIKMVMSGKLEKNSVFLYLKYLTDKEETIPFIEQMDVEILSPNSVKIDVYEKSIAGYVEYLDHYLYFDKDGIVVESSTEQTEGIPFVTGLSFDHVVLHKQLPTDDETVFKLILNITQLLTKYSMSVDRIFFDKNLNVTLYLGDIRVIIGDKENIDEKINKLQYLLPELEGKSGELHMENYFGESDKFTFEADKNNVE